MIGLEKNQKLETYDYKTNSFNPPDISLGTLFTQINVLNSIFLDNQERLDIKDLIDPFLEDKKRRSDSEEKKTKVTLESVILKAISPFPEKNVSFTMNLNEIDNLEIKYSDLSSIGNVLISIIYMAKAEKINLKQIIDGNSFNSLIQKRIDIMNVVSSLNRIKKLTFRISDRCHLSHVLNYTFILSLFFNIIFKNVKELCLDLDIEEIYNDYFFDKNPYNITQENLVENIKKYVNLFLSNYILLTLCEPEKLEITISESYRKEISIIFKNAIKPEKNDNIVNILDSIYFRVLSSKMAKNKLVVKFNSLEPYLFKEIIYLMRKFIDAKIPNLHLELFSQREKLNLRKIILNSEEDDVDINTINQNKIILYPFIEDFESSKYILDENKIPELLFQKFKNNIENFKHVLSVINLDSFYIDASLYDEICEYENYIIEIVLLIKYILYTESAPIIKQLNIKCLNINYISVEEINKQIISKSSLNTLVDMSEAVNLQSLILNMEGITLLIDFNKLPFNNLQELDITISNIEDMKNLNNSIEANRKNYKNLQKLTINLGLSENNDILIEFTKLFKNIPGCLKMLIFNIQNLIDKTILLELLNTIYMSMDYTIQKELKMILNAHSKELEVYFQKNAFSLLEEYFIKSKSKFIKNAKIKTITDGKCANIILNKFPKHDIVNSIIYSYYKITNSVKLKESIFSKIFGFLRKNREIMIMLE